MRARVRGSPISPSPSCPPAHARGHLDERARALGRHDAGQPGDAAEVGLRVGHRDHVRAVRLGEEAVVGVVERGAAVERDDERAEREGDDEPGEDR